MGANRNGVGLIAAVGAASCCAGLSSAGPVVVSFDEDAAGRAIETGSVLSGEFRALGLTSITTLDGAPARVTSNRWDGSILATGPRHGLPEGYVFEFESRISSFIAMTENVGWNGFILEGYRGDRHVRSYSYINPLDGGGQRLVDAEITSEDGFDRVVFRQQNQGTPDFQALQGIQFTAIPTPAGAGVVIGAGVFVARRRR